MQNRESQRVFESRPRSDKRRSLSSWALVWRPALDERRKRALAVRLDTAQIRDTEDRTTWHHLNLLTVLSPLIPRTRFSLGSTPSSALALKARARSSLALPTEEPASELTEAGVIFLRSETLFRVTGCRCRRWWRWWRRTTGRNAKRCRGQDQ